MLRAGVDVVRINLSHGTIEEHLAGWRWSARWPPRSDRPVGVLADLPGPKIRAGRFPDGGVDLAPGAVRLPRAGRPARAPPT